MTAGEPFRVVDQIRINANARAFFTVSDNGTLVHDPSSDLENRQITWFDRAGKQIETIGPIGAYAVARLSPDQKRIAVSPGRGNSTSLCMTSPEARVRV
ncbi:MAG: hypothetical protein IPN69_23830 [Acidobacteria bacterium]|nr:hypothetical protein [Acidobacteriota bacterium]